VAAGGLALVTGAAALAPGAARAQTDDGAYVAGAAIAEAQPFIVNMVYNNANIGLGVSAASSTFSSSTAKASASPFTFGLTLLLSSLKVCDQIAIPGELLPVATTANSDDGDGGPVEATTGTDDGALRVAAGRVRAVPDATADATVTALDFDLPGLVALTGGSATTHARSDPATMHREVTADTTVDLDLLGGLVRFTGMRFHLAQRADGADSRSTTRSVDHAVELGALSIGGVPVPLPSDPGDAAEAANQLLGPLGVRIGVPELVADGRFGHRLTPMALRIGGDSLFSDLVAAVVATPEFTELQRAVFSGLFDTATCNQLGGLFKQVPQFNSIYNALGLATPIVLAILISALAGDGTIDVQVGTARTSIDDTDYARAALDRSRPDPIRPPAAGPAPRGTTATPTASAPEPEELAIEPTRSERCATTSPAGRPMCWAGRAPLGAVVALGATAALLAADELRRRRRLLASQELPDEP
jgi:hypothetical protein